MLRRMMDAILNTDTFDDKVDDNIQICDVFIIFYLQLIMFIPQSNLNFVYLHYVLNYLKFDNHRLIFFCRHHIAFCFFPYEANWII